MTRIYVPIIIMPSSHCLPAPRLRTRQHCLRTTFKAKTKQNTFISRTEQTNKQKYHGTKIRKQFSFETKRGEAQIGK